jgi:hypothetical protein
MLQTHAAGVQALAQAPKRPIHCVPAPRHRPAAPRHGPAAPRHGPAAPRHGPAAPRHRPAAPRHRPAAPRHRPAATRHRPAATRHRPAATRHRPAATRQGCQLGRIRFSVNRQARSDEPTNLPLPMGWRSPGRKDDFPSRTASVALIPSTIVRYRTGMALRHCGEYDHNLLTKASRDGTLFRSNETLESNNETT